MTLSTTFTHTQFVHIRSWRDKLPNILCRSHGSVLRVSSQQGISILNTRRTVVEKNLPNHSYNVIHEHLQRNSTMLHKQVPYIQL